MNIPSIITNESFPLLWKEIVEEGKKAKKASRINSLITIFSQIFFALAMILFGFVVFYFIFKNDNEAQIIINTGAYLTKFLPSTLPNIVKIIIYLALAIIAPSVCCLLLRLIFSLFGAEYKNSDTNKDGLAGAESLLKAMEQIVKEQKHYDFTWSLPEHWSYNLIFSIAFLFPMILQLYLIADKTSAEGILSFILMGALIAGIGGFVLFLPIAGLKGISNFLCNKTCVFLNPAKEKEYNQAIEVLSKYINSTKQEIKKKKEAEDKKKEKERLSKEKEALLCNIQKGEELFNEAISSDNPDENVIKNAAKLGSISACYYLGKKLLSDSLSDMYTSTEKEELASDAAKYFDVARQMATLAKLDVKTECEFLWLYSRLQYESNGETEWQEMLNNFRKIQQSGNLPEEYTETLEIAIKTVVSTIDKMHNSANSQPKNNTTPTPKLYCKFRNGAICTKESNSVMIYHCNYVNDPAICPTARQGGLEYR